MNVSSGTGSPGFRGQIPQSRKTVVCVCVKIGLVDDSRSDAAAATAARLDLGRSDGRLLADGVRQHSGRGCCIAAARSRSRTARAQST